MNVKSLFITVAVALALVGCAGTKTPSVVDTNAAANTITIDNFAFTTSAATYPVGTVITVTNNDATAHTLTADDSSFDTGNLNSGQSASITLSKAGTVGFHCDIHTSMTGSITVQ